MRLVLDPRSRTPIYIQIFDQVKDLVAAGALRPGDQLPTVREVAAELRVNFNTVARAYRLLHDEGVISTQQGRGTYVLAPGPAAEASPLRRERLAGLVEGWLQEAGGSGYSPDEVKAAWADCFTRWAARQGLAEGGSQEE